MLARSANAPDRKSAAQRSRDLFATLTGTSQREREPTLAIARIRSRRGEAEASSKTAAALEGNEPMTVSRLTVVPSPEAEPASAPDGTAGLASE